jgi:hypothetical protein
VDDTERFRLRFGPYSTPLFEIGQVVDCTARGEVTIVGITSGKIAWPIGKTKRAKSLVLYGDLERAVRNEAAQSVCYWWGVGMNAVNKWRHALGIAGTTNPGTSEIRRLHFAEPWAEAAKQKSWSKAADPERREKIAASRRGKQRPPHVIEAMRKGRIGKPQSEETKQKMREAHKKRAMSQEETS